MRLKSIFEVEKNETTQKEYKDIKAKLKEKYGPGDFKDFISSKIFYQYERQSKYAKAIHKGKLKEGMTLTELEVSMICDDGFSHFGGSSTIYEDGTFKVEIYID